MWLGPITLQDALHRLKTTDKALSVARFLNKYGLRFEQAALEAGHKKLKPLEDFLPIKVVDIYQLFPLPHGTQRQGLVKSLQSWGWKAKPLQPIRRDGTGVTWEVGSDQPPPSPILPGAHGDVIVTKVRTINKDDAADPIVVSRKTRSYINNSNKPAASQDPWVIGPDPWSKTGHQQPGSSVTHCTADRLQQVEQRLTATIRKELDDHSALGPSDTDMGTGADQHDPRINRLEADIQELRQHSVRFERWFNDAAAAQSSTQQQLEAVHATVGQQQTTIIQMQSQIEQLNTSIHAEMADGFKAIEGLLNKRLRTN